LVLKTLAAHSAISAKFNKPIDPKGKTLVVQYEVNFQNGLECGGAYVKLFTDDPKFNPAELHDKTPYTIMFGPDKCGASNKIHFIFRHENKKTGEIEEKHMTSPPVSAVDKKTVLYTLVVRPDNTFEIKVDNNSVKSGTLLENFEPSVNPPKQIDDPEDKKPADWVDEAKIPDPNASKPDDWDEDAPAEIVDTEATVRKF
jgi:calnexin